ncbi:PEP/pyruvate-binding domain-containing protein [Saccharopolyspora phatthalungensis]|uniref:Pyruvate,water dikinase n=1 Tax=Saccharopolyspora phatthalungensis TaxID=664693 RepID=A0A840Q5K8_9PSEU|nr:PEP/pyruvate-binding domain-containing protein [Saccharopolyspora phatthalungensis]MBB5153969.1 pyruvate,water dikinase [Saccharopolyspora phatthalungensis]
MSTLEVQTLLDLGEIGAQDGELVGGKAANLGELLAAGFRVPPGFCISTRAYDEVCRELTGDLLDRLPGSAAEIRSRLAGAELPAGLAAAIAAAYAELGPDVPVAVRSSATAEDLPHASFAGQQDTYLNVVGEAALLDAVRRCWSSLWTERAVTYRAANGIDHRAVRLAVVVQRMVDATAAGVLFTANPVTGCRTEAVIDANTGLGESVVSGAVTPDHFVVESGRITARRLGDKPTSIRSKPGGGTESVVQQGNHPSITDDQARSLAALGADVARHYGTPQDIEWAIDGDGTLWLTQSRPITTLFPVPAEPLGGLHVYLSINVAQGVYRPITPMGGATLALMFTHLMRNLGIPTDGPQPKLWRQADGWLFADITGMTRSRIGRAVAPQVFAMAEARTGKVFESLLDDPRLPLDPKVPWPLVRRLAGIVAHTKAPIELARTLWSPKRAREQAFGLVREIRAGLARTNPSSAGERLAAAQQGLVEVAAPRIARIPPRMLPILVLSRLLPRLLGTAATAEEVQILLRGIPHNVTTEMDLELWGIAQLARQNPETARLFGDSAVDELAERYRSRTLPEKIQSGLDVFLDRDGHRTVAEIDIGVPRWSEDPAHVLGLIANYVQTGDSGHAADELYLRGAQEAERMAAEIVSRLRRKSPLRARVAGFAVDRVRQLAGLRELPKYCLVLAIANARRHLLAVGRELASTGRLAQADDVFFLDYQEVSEVLAGADHRQLVAQRRETHERELRRRHVPRVLLSDGTEPEATLPAEAVDGHLVGTSASAGTVTGTARVVHDPVRARLAPGEILVAPSTDPGWTPLFLTAGGLVMEMGGPNSHGATVAREYGIPAVVGVPDATNRIVDGRQITVHGSAGTVEIT